MGAGGVRALRALWHLRPPRGRAAAFLASSARRQVCGGPGGGLGGGPGGGPGTGPRRSREAAGTVGKVAQLPEPSPAGSPRARPRGRALLGGRQRVRPDLKRNAVNLFAPDGGAGLGRPDVVRSRGLPGPLCLSPAPGAVSGDVVAVVQGSGAPGTDRRAARTRSAGGPAPESAATPVSTAPRGTSRV